MEKMLLYYNKFKIYITNSIWVLIGLITRTLIMIFLISKIANLLGVSEFGWYNYAISVFTILYSISGLGFGDTFIIKYFSESKFTTEEIIGTTFFSRILFSTLIIILLSLWIIITDAENTYWIVTIACLSIVFQSSEVFTSYFQYKFKANIYVSVTLIALAIEAVLLIVGIYNDWSLIYFISIYTFERAMIMIGLMFFLNIEIQLTKLKFKKSIFRFFLLQSWPLLLGAILTALYARFDQVLIKHFLLPKDLGIYGTSIILSQMWYVVPSLIIPILFPKIADLKNSAITKKYYDLIYIVYGVLNYLALIIIIFILIFGKFIVLALYGPAYLDSVFILYLLTFNLIILFQSHLTSNIMILENEEKYLFKIKLISVTFNIVLNIIFLSTLGVVFAAYSLILSSLISWIGMSFFNKRMFELMKINIRSFMLPFHYKSLLK